MARHWAARAPRNLWPVLLVNLHSRTRAPRAPLAVPWARPRAATTWSPRSLMLPHSPVTTLLMEVPGLIPGAVLRPADFLDLSICSPHTQEAGTDCTQPGLVATLNHCGPHLPSPLRQSAPCTPIMWCAYGRLHQDTLIVLRSLSKSLARERNFVSADVVVHRLHSSVTLEIWTRSATQTRSCWPVCGRSCATGPRPVACVWGSPCSLPLLSLAARASVLGPSRWAAVLVLFLFPLVFLHLRHALRPPL